MITTKYSVDRNQRKLLLNMMLFYRAFDSKDEQIQLNYIRNQYILNLKIDNTI